MCIWCLPWIGYCLFLKKCPQRLTWIPTLSSSQQTLKQNDVLGGLTQFLLYLSRDILYKRKSKHVFALTLIFAQMICIFVYTFVCVCPIIFPLTLSYSYFCISNLWTAFVIYYYSVPLSLGLTLPGMQCILPSVSANTPGFLRRRIWREKWHVEPEIDPESQVIWFTQQAGALS